MPETQAVTLLITGNLAGELAILPRLMTLINQHKQAAEGPVFLLDVGDSCSTESWICRATQGRAPFLVLDAMGYDAVIIGGPEQVPIPIPALRKVKDQVGLTWIIWNRVGYLTKRAITVTVAAGSADWPITQPEARGIRVNRAITALPARDENPPVIGDVAQGDLLRIVLDWSTGRVQTAQRSSVQSDMPVDPTIAAVVDLVESEAKQSTQAQGDEG